MGVALSCKPAAAAHPRHVNYSQYARFLPKVRAAYPDLAQKASALLRSQRNEWGLLTRRRALDLDPGKRHLTVAHAALV